jgi:phosphate transport system permease protein
MSNEPLDQDGLIRPEHGQGAGDLGKVGHKRDWGLAGLSFVATISGIVALFVLLTKVCIDAWGWLDWQFLTSAPSRFPEEAGIFPALIGSVLLIVTLMPIAVVLGVGAAIYLTEYAPRNWFVKFVHLNISNLAGVPSVVWGLLGLGIFIQLPPDRLELPHGTLLVGALTMALLVLPIVIIASLEAIRAVPDSFREGSYGMGATRWQTVRRVVLPRAIPGIMTGTIIALARALGETAPLIMIGVPTAVWHVPKHPFDKFTTMTMQIFRWADYPQEEFKYGVMAAGVVTLLVSLLSLNAVAVIIRHKTSSRV